MVELQTRAGILPCQDQGVGEDVTQAELADLAERMPRGEDQLERMAGERDDRKPRRQDHAGRRAHEGQIRAVGLHHAPRHPRRSVDQGQLDRRLRQPVSGDDVA